MGDKAKTPAGAAGRAPTADRPSAVRNVVLVGHSGSGKTTLVEALAQTAGAVNRAGRVEDGGTVSDYDEIEHRQQRSVQLSLVPVGWDGYKINLLDTPGYADFVGELRAGLRAADAALFVVSAAQEADAVAASTRMIWEECAAVGMPRAIVVTHLDTARTGFDELTAVCAGLFGRDDPDAVLPLYLPVRGAEGADGHAPATGLVGLLSERIFDYSSGVRRENPPDETQRELIAEARARLIEGIIAESEDETLMDRYLGGEEIDVKTLVDDLEKAVARGAFHPVLAAAPAADGGTQGLGTLELLELITGGFPSPWSTRRPPSPPPTDAPGPRSPATPRGRWSPRSSRRPPTPTWDGSPWSGSSPARCAPTRPCTCPATASPTGPTTARSSTRRTSGSAGSPPPSAGSSARSRSASRATSPASPGSATPRPATPSPPRTIRS